MTRTFTATPAIRAQVPLLIGIMSPSGGGKTYSALRLATGMQQVVGGDIYGIDTENNRMLHYADEFKFQHVPFSAPFGSLDYLECLRQCNAKGARITIVDSMTHEHTGEGGYLETAENVINRIAGDDYAKREKAKFAGWAKAGPLRTKMIEGIKQLDGTFIFCWRAKQKTKPIKGPTGKMEVVELGLMPIAGEEWVYEMAVNCMLPPRAEGVPLWRADHVGEKMMMKLPAQFKGIFAKEQPLSEEIGAALARWAKGDTLSPSPDAATGAPSVSADPTGGAPTITNETSKSDDGPGITEIDSDLAAAAEHGSLRLQQVWTGLKPAQQKMLKAALDRRHKPRAMEVDAKTDALGCVISGSIFGFGTGICRSAETGLGYGLPLIAIAGSMAIGSRGSS